MFEMSSLTSSIILLSCIFFMSWQFISIRLEYYTLLSISPGKKKKSGFTTDSCPAHSKSVLTSKKIQIFLAFNGCLSVFLQEGFI